MNAYERYRLPLLIIPAVHVVVLIGVMVAAHIVDTPDSSKWCLLFGVLFWTYMLVDEICDRRGIGTRQCSTS